MISMRFVLKLYLKLDVKVFVKDIEKDFLVCYMELKNVILFVVII